MLFSTTHKDMELERMMTSVPGFGRRGHGVYVFNRFKYTAKDCDCRLCSHYDRKKKCKLPKCVCIEERIEAGAIGYHLLSQLGAEETDYGIISARGHSLYELVPYNEPEVKELNTQSLTDEKLEVVEILDRPALFSNGRIADDEIPIGLYKYDLRQSDDGDGFCTVEPHVSVNHGGTILLQEALEFGESGYIALDEDSSPNFTGKLMTAEDFADADFTEEQDGGMTLE